ncbi:DUF5080 family protein [Mammaliicoccus sp. Dog046]|uniref:DUF5080 family protein n=1 Tax=Mammaliicoccus sp. Dog046 TaxID=3034233 RepID=UPI002B2624FC|nr:DUF5080 family protein [Mammaliicoccus sp. Dog046]WQK85603.1 DUF5080 family protein [Mammaliicoccus sp. Dog046]
MVYVVLIVLFVLYYLATLEGLLKSEGLSLFGLLIDVITLGILIGIYFLGDIMRGNDLSIFLMFTHIGSYVFMYFAIKSFWVRPKLLVYAVQREQNVKKEDLGTERLELQIARYKGVYLFGISVVLLIIAKLRMIEPLIADQLDMNPIFILVGLIIIIIWLILDIYRKIKYGIFLFKSIVPIVVTAWIIFGTIILQ